MALSKITEWAGSAVIGQLVSMGFSYLGDRKLPANSVAELKRIETALPQIKAVMGIAEALKMKDPIARQWVEQFRLVVEASEDVLDEVEYKKLEDTVKDRGEAGESASSSKKRKSCTINDDTLERLKEAVTMLDQAAHGVGNLLQSATHLGIQNLFESRQEAVNRETTSFLVESELFGREVEKHKIIDWLKRPTDARLSSFGIVGVGGLGKTTLVQYAYQEMRGSNHFDKTIWVCVSTNFSVEDITRKMLGELGENNCSNKPFNALQETLEENLHSKKILLVLDDIWDDEKRSKWEKLVAPLRFVNEGSKIIFTTRMKSVADLLASVIRTEHESLSLQQLREQDLRLLFQSYAFHGFNLESHRDLQAIGDQILKMLRGSPLAAKVIGSLLNTRMDHQYWRRVLNQGSLFNLEQAKDVVEVLKLSYYHLPANLQVCFRFCSIFPQDHQFDKDELIKMWICSGFIRQQSSQEERPEDIGEDYFNLLLRKSFFEYSGESLFLGIGHVYYVMHDLVHELAQNVSHGECCRIERNDESITIPSTVRHVYVHEREMEKVSHLENLRSLVITSDWNSFVLPNNLIKKSLRLLEIRGSRNSEMPKEISYLVHLLYLSVDGPQPYYVIDKTFKYLLLASVYKLYHLQVLEIPGDNEVAINSAIEITGVTNLLRLRYMRLPKEIMQTIHGVNKLTSLQELTFFVGQESGQRINELGTLKNLRHLFIENIENIGDHTEAKSANLLGKNNLMSLSLEWTSESNPIHPEEIIDYLQPPPSLMELTIINYNGQRSPIWMEESLPLNLSSLKLLDCPLWKNQLFSGKMPYLKILDIRSCLNLDKLPDMPLSLTEFRISDVGLTSLPSLYQNSGNNTSAPLSLKSSLRVVEIEKCPNLISLHGFLQQDNLDLQAMEKLTINGCKRLAHLPTHGFGKLTSLKCLKIQSCQNLNIMDCSTSLPLSLIEFQIFNVGLTYLPTLYQNYGNNIPAPLSQKSLLRVVEIKKCPDLISLHGLLQQDNLYLQAMEKLTINGCKRLVHLPTHGFEKLTSLKYLNIEDCPDLIEFPTLLPLSLTEFCINNVGLSVLPEYYESPDSSSGTSTSSLKIVQIENCQNLRSLNGFLQQDNIDFQSIEEIKVKSCKKLVKHTSREQAHGANRGSNLASLKIKSLDIDDLSLLLIEPLRSLSFVSDLSVYSCSWMKALLEQWILQNSSTLKRLALSDVRNLNTLPATMVRLTALEELNIWDANWLKKLPELPASLRELFITDANSLKSLPATMVRLTALKKLKIMNAGLLEELPELPASIRELSITGANSLKPLPATMVRLTALEKLEIMNAGLLEELPELPASVRELSITGASSLKSLPATMVRLTALKKLKIVNAGLLEELPELLASLTELSITGASSLKSLPATMVRLTALERLEIMNAGLLEELPELPASLRELSITGASSLKSLPATMVRLTALERLEIMNAGLLEELPELPASLTELSITGASSLKSLPATMVRLTALERLEIMNAGLLEELPELPASLRELSITGASSLKSLPATMVRLTALERLEIMNAGLLEELPELPASLTELSITGASSLKSLPATMVRLTALERLEIMNAGLLEELPELPASLTELSITGASSLKSLPATMVRLTALERLEIMNAGLLEELPELPASLRELSITGASSLKSLPATMVRLTALERLEIMNAGLLEELPELPASLIIKRIS